MIIDLRKQNRTIKIEFEATGNDNLDDYIDDIVKDLQVILRQRKQLNKLKIEIFLL